ncbi:MAG: hypothetical protein WCN95_07990 [bacterium]
MNLDVYATADFPTVTWLLCNDASLIRAERVADRRVVFVFSGKGFCEGLVQQMFFNDAVPLTRVLSEIKKARSVIHSTN